MKTNHPYRYNLNRLIFGFLFTLLILVCVSCETLDHWLFNASDYSIRDSKNDDDDLDEKDIYWDDVDYDIWFDENEYD